MRSTLTILPIALLFFACRKEPVGHVTGVLGDPPPAPKRSTYWPLQQGSYWIYENYSFYPPDQWFYQTTDSAYIYGDTLIDGSRYSIMENTSTSQFRIAGIFRDSMGCVIGLNSPELCEATFDTYFSEGYLLGLSDTISYYYEKYVNKDSIVHTPAGTFTTITRLGTFPINPPYRKPGVSYPKYSINVYAKDVGLVYRSMGYVSADNLMVTRLVRYKINE